MTRHTNRRQFLKRSALAGAGLWAAGACAIAQNRSPNEKLNIGIIGVHSRGAANMAAVASENIAALCDVNDDFLAEAAKKHPQAKTYVDWRKLLDQKDIDAVIVSTTEHTHALASVMAMKRGKHVFCEKPLAHSVYEARVMRETSKKTKVATQMGTQIHASDTYRRVVELVQSGAIGPVREVHVWLGANFKNPPKPTDMSQPDVPADRPPVPPYLDWNLWLGPAPERPYHPTYVPGHWRSWWAFGNGTLGDFFCHYCDLAFWALKLRYPTSVEAEGPVHPESAARWTIARLEFPARETLPPVSLTWYNGGGYPALVNDRRVPEWGNAVLFVGSEGMLIADYGQHKLLPEAKYADFKRPDPTIPDSIGHHREWLSACKTGGPTTCNFEYSGPLTEAALLCNVALRSGKKIQWDAAALSAVDCPEAAQYLRREYRQGWTL